MQLVKKYRIKKSPLDILMAAFTSVALIAINETVYENAKDPINKDLIEYRVNNFY